MPKDLPASDAAAQTEIIEADFCVIGAGSGGLALAAAAAAYGQRVVLIEKHKMGGDGLNYGSVPSKALLAAAKRANAMRTASLFGIRGVEPLIDHRAVQEHVKDVIARIAPNAAVERFAGLGVRVITSAGRFVDKSTVSAGDYRIRARRFVIATGSSPVIPPIPGLADVPYFTNESIFENADPLPHLIVIGAGSTGLELAQAYRRLGSRVTVIDAAHAIAEEDPELAVVLLTRLSNEGIDIREGVRITRVSGGQGRIAVEIESRDGTETIEGSDLLLAAGRKANIADLGLETAAHRASPTRRSKSTQVSERGTVACSRSAMRQAALDTATSLQTTPASSCAGRCSASAPAPPAAPCRGSSLPTPSLPTSASVNRRRAQSTARSTCCAGPTMRTIGRRRSEKPMAISRS